MKLVAIGIDIGGTNLKYGLVTRDGQVVSMGVVPTVADSGPAGIESGMAEAVLASRRASKGYRIVAAGLGIPGTVSGPDGTILTTPPQIQGLRGMKTARILARLAGVPAVADNDATVAGLAEVRIGAGNGARNMLLVTMGTGLGGALIVHGAVVRGRHGTGGEIGHAMFVPDGLPCAHGGRGCLELYASATALLRFHREAGGRADATARQVIENARKGDRVALGALETVGRNLGLGIASAATVCAPDIVVVGGGLSAAGRLLLAPAAAAFRAQALEFVAKGCRIVRAKTGNDAGLIGAALLAFEELEKASQPG